MKVFFKMTRVAATTMLALSIASPMLAQPGGYLYENPAWYTANAPRSVRALDLNGDGFDDMLAAGRRGQVAVHLNTGDGTMLPATFIQTGNGNPAGSETEDIAVADLNGDTFPDFAVANSFSESLQTFINDGAGGFTLRDTIASPNLDGFRGVAIGDPNNDGLPDLLGVQSGQDFLQLYRALRVRSLPATFVIDRNGRIVHQHRGEVTRAIAERLLLPLL